MKKYICSLALLALPMVVGAQTLDYRQYMQAVARDNTALMAEKYNVEIAAANLQAAKVFNDPELSVAYTDNEDNTLMMGRSYEAGLSYGFSLGGGAPGADRSRRHGTGADRGRPGGLFPDAPRGGYRGLERGLGGP